MLRITSRFVALVRGRLHRDTATGRPCVRESIHALAAGGHDQPLATKTVFTAAGLGFFAK